MQVIEPNVFFIWVFGLYNLLHPRDIISFSILFCPFRYEDFFVRKKGDQKRKPKHFGGSDDMDMDESKDDDDDNKVVYVILAA